MLTISVLSSFSPKWEKKFSVPKDAFFDYSMYTELSYLDAGSDLGKCWDLIISTVLSRCKTGFCCIDVM